MVEITVKIASVSTLLPSNYIPQFITQYTFSLVCLFVYLFFSEQLFIGLLDLTEISGH